MLASVINCATVLRGLESNYEVIELLDRTNRIAETLTGTKEAQLMGWSPRGSIDIRINIETDNLVHKEVADSLVEAINERLVSIVRLAILNVQSNALDKIKLICPAGQITGPPCESAGIGISVEGAG